ncbi:MAG: pseudouridine synthase [Acidiferrobacterales bacterium]
MKSQSRLILLNKPCGVLCQFTDENGRRTLADYVPVKDVYAAGRLDRDSEGLVLLTGDGALQHQLSDPRHQTQKIYWAQVEGIPSNKALDKLRRGILIKGQKTRPADIDEIDEPDLWLRDPPIRVRKNIPTRWLEIKITEGRNRQVRHMTAAVGLPTLRLVRVSIGEWNLADLMPGQWRDAEASC